MLKGELKSCSIAWHIIGSGQFWFILKYLKKCEKPLYLIRDGNNKMLRPPNIKGESRLWWMRTAGQKLKHEKLNLPQISFKMRNSIVFLFLSQAFLAFSSTTLSPLNRRTTCGEYEVACGNTCCGELIMHCADASKSLCCDQNEVEIDGICCAQGGTVINGVCCAPGQTYMNGICCTTGQSNCGGKCCPGFCLDLVSIPRIPLAKRNVPICISTAAGCKTLPNASGKICSQSSDCGEGSWSCTTGCCIDVPIIPR